MWIVADRAGCQIDGVILVSLLKGRLVAVVATETKSRLRLHQKVFLVRAMGEMACRTPLCPNLVDDLLFVIALLVTLKTCLIPLCFQQVAVRGGMRVVALNTFFFLQGRMHIGLVQPDLFFAVAWVANFISLFLQKHLGDQTVPEVAVFTFLLLDDRVDILHPQILIRKLLVAIETILAGKFLPRSWGASQRPRCRSRGTGVQQNRDRKKEYPYKDDFMSEFEPWHDFSLLMAALGIEHGA